MDKKQKTFSIFIFFQKILCKNKFSIILLLILLYNLIIVINVFYTCIFLGNLKIIYI